MKKINAEIKIKGKLTGPLKYKRNSKTGEYFAVFTIFVPTNQKFINENGDEKMYCNFYEVAVFDDNEIQSLSMLSSETILEVKGYLKFTAKIAKSYIKESIEENEFHITANVYAKKVKVVKNP